MDYRRFLNKSDERTLPYFGGAFVDAEDRRLRVATPFEPAGWYRFKIEGRHATKLCESDVPDLFALPKVTGWHLDGQLVQDAAIVEPLHLMPGEQPAKFAKLTARRWRSGELLFSEVDFETEVEGQAREALAVGGSLKDVKGVPAPLRAAFAYALVAQASRRTGIRFVPGEVRGQVVTIAAGGAEAASTALAGLEAERILARREQAEVNARHAAAMVRAEVEVQREIRIAALRDRQRKSEDWAEAALEAAGARLEDARDLGNGELEVVFRFMNHRFISIVEAATLRVIDSGICLGHPPRDDLVTLESLPSVIKEAIETHALVMLRFP